MELSRKWASSQVFKGNEGKNEPTFHRSEIIYMYCTSQLAAGKQSVVHELLCMFRPMFYLPWMFVGVIGNKQTEG